jgi:drug/metabolite transporter (DMT)-like permease
VSPRSIGTALCLVSAAGYGAVGVFGKLGYDRGLTPNGTLAGRFGLAALVLWVIVLAAGDRWLPSRRGLFAGVALGAAIYAAQAGFFFQSLTRLDAAIAVLIAYVAPVLVALTAVVLGRERLGRAHAVALPVALAGTALVALGGGSEAQLDGIGVLLALACAVMFAAYMLLSHAVVGRVHPIGLSASVCTGCAISFTSVAAVRGELPDTGPTGWTLVVAMALVSTVLAVTALAAGTERIGPSAASLVSTFEPVVAAALAGIVLGETLAPLQFLGGAFVIASVVILSLGRTPAPADGPAGALPL